jgi:hypothetical protein
MLHKLKGLFSIGKENEVHVVVVVMLDLHAIYTVIDTYLHKRSSDPLSFTVN